MSVLDDYCEAEDDDVGNTWLPSALYSADAGERISDTATAPIVGRGKILLSPASPSPSRDSVHLGGVHLRGLGSCSVEWRADVAYPRSTGRVLFSRAGGC